MFEIFVYVLSFLANTSKTIVHQGKVSELKTVDTSNTS